MDFLRVKESRELRDVDLSFGYIYVSRSEVVDVGVARNDACVTAASVHLVTPTHQLCWSTARGILIVLMHFD